MLKFSSKFKKIIAATLTVSVFFVGSFTTASGAIASGNKNVVERSRDGKSIKVIKDGKVTLDVEKKDNFEATVSRTTSNGETENITITVEPTKDGYYKVTFIDKEGTKVESIESINPLDEKGVNIL